MVPSGAGEPTQLVPTSSAFALRASGTFVMIVWLGATMIRKQYPIPTVENATANARLRPRKPTLRIATVTSKRIVSPKIASAQRLVLLSMPAHASAAKATARNSFERVKRTGWSQLDGDVSPRGLQPRFYRFGPTN